MRSTGPASGLPATAYRSLSPTGRGRAPQPHGGGDARPARAAAVPRVLARRSSPRRSPDEGSPVVAAPRCPARGCGRGRRRRARETRPPGRHSVLRPASTTPRSAASVIPRSSHALERPTWPCDYTCAMARSVRDAAFGRLPAAGADDDVREPGSTEVPFLAGLPDHLRFPLGLHEGTVVGIAQRVDRPRRAGVGAAARLDRFVV